MQNDFFTIKNDVAIRDAMEVINLNCRGVVCVLNEDNVLVGVVSDGEIRRALVHEATMFTPVSKIMNMNYLFLIFENENEIEAQKIFIDNPQITVLPVINKERRIKKLYYKKNINTMELGFILY